MSSTVRVDINCDMGESYGRWDLGNDQELMAFVTSVNVAAGYHAGDPPTIRATVEAAVERGLQIGVHLALPDLMGFGRRMMQVAPNDLTDYCTYQIGAVAAFAKAAGAALGHVKPHGALYTMASRDAEVADAVASAIARFNPNLPLLLLNDTCRGAASNHGVTVVTEGFPDLHYDDQGELLIERRKVAWDPDVVAQRAVQMATRQQVISRDGKTLHVDVRTLCIHGDAPNAVEVARAVRSALVDNDVDVAPLNILLLR